MCTNNVTISNNQYANLFTPVYNFYYSDYLLKRLIKANKMFFITIITAHFGESETDSIKVFMCLVIAIKICTYFTMISGATIMSLSIWSKYCVYMR